MTAPMEEPRKIDIEALVDNVSNAYGDQVEYERAWSPAGHRNVWASGYHPCLKRMYHDCADGGQRPAPDTNALARMAYGSEREESLKVRLIRAGKRAADPFVFVGGQERIELVSAAGRLLISGKIDGKLLFSSGAVAVCEIKSWAPHVAERIESWEDVLAGEWTRAAAYQLAAYVVGIGADLGVLVLDRKGLPVLLPMDLDYARQLAREFRALAGGVCDILDDPDGEAPGYTDRPWLCRHCWCGGTVCHPPTVAPGVEIDTDEETVEMVRDWYALTPDGKRWGALDRKVKSRFRGVERAIVGDVMLEGEWRPRKVCELTAEAKSQIDRIRAQHTERKEHGAFYLSAELIDKGEASK